MDVVEEVVCLTGASGDLASWLVKLLLYRGYTVKANCSRPQRPKENATFACCQWGSKERLQLFKADLLEEGSFDVIVRGCAGVFHAASPMILTCTDPKARAKSHQSSVRPHIVYGLSYVQWKAFDDLAVNKTWFSNLVLCEESKNWYVLSKNLAEQAAWNFATEKKIDMVTLHPFVTGLLLQPNLNLSAEVFLILAKGAGTIPMESCRFIDVKRQRMHISQHSNLLPPSADIVCSNKSCTAQKLYPEMLFLEKSEERGRSFTPMYKVSRETAERPAFIGGELQGHG